MNETTNFSRYYEPTKEILGTGGEWISGLSAGAIKYIASLGVNVDLMTSKIITILISLALLYLFLKVLTIPKKIIKYAIIVFLVLLIISIFASFFT